MSEKKSILLAHGGGGTLSEQLISKHILPKLQNEILNQLTDSALINIDSAQILFTTDSYVVKPLFFNGGDIGKLAVCGTVNDLAVAGARPVALSLSLILETGLEIDLLDRILDSIGRTAKASSVNIVTGDTKTVEAGSADQIFINTAGIGAKIENTDLGFDRIKPGDKIIINGTIGDHGMTIMSLRKNIKFQSDLKSDCAALSPLTIKLLESLSLEIKFMRDPTRGGLAMALNDISKKTSFDIEIDEDSLPVNLSVQAAADMLGFDLFNIANEGKFITVVSAEAAEQCLAIQREHPLGKDAAIIGEIGERSDVPLVQLNTRIGGKRIVQTPYGRELPRIC